MNRRIYFILLFLAIVVYILNLRLDLMEVDAAQYGEISREMLYNHSFLKLYCLNQDYLDKPPLLFWLSSFCFWLFGVHNFAYKLPSFFFALIAIFSTYRLSKMYYSEKTSLMAATMLATTQAMFLITNDVRTDTLLLGSIVFSIWQFAVFFEFGETIHLLAGSFGVALAMLTKGPIGLVATGAALLPHLILRREWKKIFDWRILIGAFVIAGVLLPRCIALYQQFGMYGLKFSFWIQSFGRITGESDAFDNPDKLFLLHSTAWAFLPWSLFLLLGWGSAITDVVRRKFKLPAGKEAISVLGFTVVLIMLSFSQELLPYYIFIAYPLAAIMSAKGFMQLSSWPSARPWLTGLQLAFIITLIVFTFLIQYALKEPHVISIICLITLYPLAIWAAVKSDRGIKTYCTFIRYLRYRFERIYSRKIDGKSGLQPTIVFGLNIAYKKLFFASGLIFIVFNLMLSLFYYPAILKYQPQDDFGRYIKIHGHNNWVCYNMETDYAIAFYARQIPVYLTGRKNFKKILDSSKDLLVYTSVAGLHDLNEEHISYIVIEQRERFYITMLNIGFLNPTTRSAACDTVYLLEAKAP